jgi:hypothetical protein
LLFSLAKKRLDISQFSQCIPKTQNIQMPIVVQILNLKPWP